MELMAELPGVATMLDGVRVIEVADEKAEYAGLLLAGLGADVIKVEPPGGGSTRRIGPFYQDRPVRLTLLLALQPGQALRRVRPRVGGGP